MLLDTYTLAPGGADQLAMRKQFADNGKSKYSVAGLSPNAARDMSVSHEVLSNGRVRSMISLNATDVNPDSPSGAVGVSRVYIVIDRQPFKTAAEVKSMFAQLNTLTDDTSFLDLILNREV